MCEPWLNETYQIHSVLVSQDRQNCPGHWGAGGHWRGIDSTMVTRTEPVHQSLNGARRGWGGGGGRAVTLWKEGWEHILVDGTF